MPARRSRSRRRRHSVGPLPYVLFHHSSRAFIGYLPHVIRNFIDKNEPVPLCHRRLARRSQSYGTEMATLSLQIALQSFIVATPKIGFRTRCHYHSVRTTSNDIDARYSDEEKVTGVPWEECQESSVPAALARAHPKGKQANVLSSPRVKDPLPQKLGRFRQQFGVVELLEFYIVKPDDRLYMHCGCDLEEALLDFYIWKSAPLLVSPSTGVSEPLGKAIDPRFRLLYHGLLESAHVHVLDLYTYNLRGELRPKDRQEKHKDHDTEKGFRQSIYDGLKCRDCGTMECRTEHKRVASDEERDMSPPPPAQRRGRSRARSPRDLSPMQSPSLSPPPSAQPIQRDRHSPARHHRHSPSPSPPPFAQRGHHERSHSRSPAPSVLPQRRRVNHSPASPKMSRHGAGANDRRGGLAHRGHDYNNGGRRHSQSPAHDTHRQRDHGHNRRGADRVDRREDKYFADNREGGRRNRDHRSPRREDTYYGRDSRSPRREDTYYAHYRQGGRRDRDSRSPPYRRSTAGHRRDNSPRHHTSRDRQERKRRRQEEEPESHRHEHPDDRQEGSSSRYVHEGRSTNHGKRAKRVPDSPKSPIYVSSDGESAGMSKASRGQTHTQVHVKQEPW